MARRDFVTFDAAYPDDAQFDGQGNPVIPGGRAVAEAIRNKLQDAGVFCSDLGQHGFYGWAFFATSENTKVLCLLQTGDAWLLLLELQESLVSRLFGSPNYAGLDDIQTRVHDILTSDKRFSKVLWYTKADYEGGKKERGLPSPR